MTLSELRAATIPRPDALARKLAKKIEPTIGFVIYGIVFAFVVANSVLLATTLGVAVALGGRVSETIVDIVAIVLTVGGQVALWGLYVRWIRRKRAYAAALIYDGELVEGVVDNDMRSKALTITAAMAGAHGGAWSTVKLPDGRWMLCPFPKTPESGTATTVLCKPGYTYALAFLDERPIVAGVHEPTPD